MSENNNIKEVKKNVLSEIVANNLCIGCGVCAGICPRGNLKIEFNKYGEYNAFETGAGCGEKCDLCLKVCPFYNHGENEDTLGKRLFANISGIEHTKETGYYLDAFVGYSNVDGHRANGASGGMATWTLETLLKENLVDYVACVSPNKSPNKLFKFEICRTLDEVRACSRSCYYPVETSEIIKYILSHDGRYAIIGLPCVCKAIRLAMLINPKLQKRIRYVLGLVCGGGKSTFFAEYACSLRNVSLSCLQQIFFRIKCANRSGYDYGVEIHYSNGQRMGLKELAYMSDGIGRLWGNMFFTPRVCHFCTDVFCELADVVFMDAWPSLYNEDPHGHSIILIRNPSFAKVFRNNTNHDLNLTFLSIDQVIQRQRNLIESKQCYVTERVAFAKVKGVVLPLIRPSMISDDSLSILRKALVRKIWDGSQIASDCWICARRSHRLFENIMYRRNLILTVLRSIIRLSNDPLDFFKVIQRKICKFCRSRMRC